jgi:hypothetical protein
MVALFIKLKRRSPVRQSRNAAVVAPVINVGEVEVVPIGSVKPWAKNPRTLENVDVICKLLGAYGQMTPVVVWTEDNQIRKGNATYAAMKKMGYDNIAVLYRDFANVAEADSYALADNAASDAGAWSPEKRLALMQSEYISNQSPEALGLSDKEFKTLQLSMIKPEKLPDVDIIGSQEGISFMMIIQFDSQDAVQEFKDIVGVTMKHQRVVPWVKLKPFISTYGNTPENIPQDPPIPQRIARTPRTAR